MRIDPEPEGSEFTLLAQYLDYQRETVLMKTDGLTQPQMVQNHPPSAFTLCRPPLITWPGGGTRTRSDSARFLPEREPPGGIDWEADPTGAPVAGGQAVAPRSCGTATAPAVKRSRVVVSAASGLEQLSAQPMRDGRRPSTSMGAVAPQRGDGTPRWPRRHAA